MKQFRIILIPATALFVLSGCHRWYNWTGAHQEKAVAEAKDFVAADPSLDGSEIECKKHDSDGDGDVTCTVFAPDGERITLECPDRKFWRFTEDQGCKETLRLSGKIK